MLPLFRNTVNLYFMFINEIFSKSYKLIPSYFTNCKNI